MIASNQKPWSICTRLLVVTVTALIPLSGIGEESQARPEPIGWAIDSYPHLSPDGSRVVFQSNRSGANQIWTMQPDGTGLVQLTNDPEQQRGQGAETPAWSPDGEWIVYTRYVEKDNNDVFIMRADGSQQTRLTFSPGYDGHPHWSADGEQIVFNSNRDTPDPSEPWHKNFHDLWSIRPDGSDEKKLLACDTVCTYAALSPDNTQLLYRRVDNTPGLNWVHDLGARNSEIYLHEFATGESRLIAGHPAFDGWPLWSPDGEWIVFASNRAAHSLSAQVWRVRPDGRDLQQLTHGEWSHTQPSWSSDGRSIWVYRFQESDAGETGGAARLLLDDIPSP